MAKQFTTSEKAHAFEDQIQAQIEVFCDMLLTDRDNRALKADIAFLMQEHDDHLVSFYGLY